MERIFRRAIAAAAMVFVFAGCGDEDLIFAGGTAGPAVAIDLTTSLFELRAGETVTIGMQGRDAAGNAVTASTPTIASGDASVVTAAAGAANDNFAATATVTATGMGETIITVTLGSLSETLTARVGPGSMLITGPDTVGSGNDGQFAITALDINGAAASGTPPLDWVTTNTGRMVVDAAGLASGRGTGSVTLNVRGAGGAGATKTVVVAPGVFAGTLSATTGDAGALLTITRAADGAPFDDDTEVNLSGEDAWVESFTANDLVIGVPSSGVAGAQDLSIVNIGPGQLEQKTTFTANTAFGDTYQPGNTTNDCTLPTTSPDLMAIRSANNYVYFSHGGFGTGSASRGCQNGGAQIDHYFTLTAGASDLNVDLFLEWDNGSDVDIIVCSDPVAFTCAFTFFSGDDENEDGSGVTIPAGETWYVVITMWVAGTDISNLRMGVN